MDFTLNLSENISIFKGVFKNNCMIVYRSMENAENKNIKAEMVFADGLSGAVLLNDSIVKPFCKTKIPDTSDMLDYIHKSVLRSNEVTRTSKMDDCVTALFSGRVQRRFNRKCKKACVTFDFRTRKRAFSERPEGRIFGTYFG